MNPKVTFPINPDTPVSHLPFSPVVRVGDLVFVSGVSSRRHDNTHEGVTIHADGRVDKDIKAQSG
jgi:enamine deaminase RidA (YjgF/YER057c/UK114 family)